MNFFDHIRIRTVGWAFIVMLVLLGALFIGASLTTLKNITEVRATWNTFEASRSEKSRAINALREELGYGGMIHNFKNYILRHDQERVSVINAKLGGAHAAIANYTALGLNESEETALSHIQEMLAAYSAALVEIGPLILNGKKPAEIDKLVRVNDATALQGLDSLDREVSKNLNRRSNNLSKPEILSSLRRALGYGGMIHEFKNFVLRHDHKRIKLIEKHFDEAQEALDQYAALGLTPAETTAITTIRQMIDAYGKALKIVDEHGDSGITPERSDSKIRIDDQPALAALTTLTREIARQVAIDAENVNAALILVSTVAESTAWIVSIIIFILVVGTIWAFHDQIIAPITKMTGTMTKLASGNMDVEIEETGKENEIGEMARAVDIFKVNAIARLQAEDSLKEQEERYRLILDNAADGIITINEEGIIELFNPAAEHIFGYNANEIIGKSLDLLLPPSITGHHTDFIANYRETGIAKIIGLKNEFDGKRRDSSLVPLELGVTEVTIDQRKLFTGIVRDITERKAADRMKNEFVSTVSHELRTPLTSIKGSLGLIKSGVAGQLPEKLTSMLDIAYNNCDRLVRLINDILDMEKISAGKMDFTMSSLDLGALLEQAVEANKGYGEDRNITLALTESLPDAIIEGDHDRLMQVMANLLSNAAKFSPEGGQIEIALKAHNGGYRVSVSDHGPGIGEEFQDKIFEKFSQADSSDVRQKGGTGLGLSITRAIVEYHRGTIAFDTQIGLGTTFYFDLPILGTCAPQALDMTHKGAVHTILIVEDDPDTALLLQMLLQKDGFRTDIARDAGQARELLDKNDYDAMTLDLILPDEDGTVLFRDLRKQPKTKDLPIIVVSAKAIEGSQEINGDAVGVIDWMEKPIDEDRLSQGLRQALLGVIDGMPHVLHVEDDPDVVKIVAALLEEMATVKAATTFAEAKKALETEHFDLVILDLMLPDGNGGELLPYLKKDGKRKTPVIVFSAKDTPEELASNINAALVKSQTTNEALLETIRSAIHDRHSGKT